MANLAGTSNSGSTPSAYNYGMLRHALSMRCGQGISCEILSDMELDEFIEAARREINRMSALWYWSSFQTVAGVQRYSAASILPNNYLGQVKVFYQGGGSAGCSNVLLFPGFGSQWDVMMASAMALVGSTLEYERIQAMVKMYSRLQKVFKPRGWLERDGYIWLDPVPGAAQAVYFACDIPRFSNVVGAGGIDEVWAEAFFDYAGARTCEMLAMKQSEVAAGDDGGGKSVRTAGGAVYLKLAEKLERRFYDQIQSPLSAKVISGMSGS